jgi:hypothetical protein
MDAIRQPTADAPSEPRSWPLHLTTFLLLGVVLVLSFLLEREKTSGREAMEQRALNARDEQDHLHARNVAAVFLRAVVEDDYPATRLLKRVATTRPRSPGAYGPEVALREKIRAWLAERNLAEKRLTGYGFGGNPLDTNLREGRCVQIGALHFEDGGFVNYRLTLSRTDARNGSGSTDYGWRVDEFLLWSGERDGPQPW